MQIEIETGTEDVLAQQTVLSGLIDRDLQARHGDRILRTDIDVALGRADGVARDGHRLDDAVRVAFQHGAVHERTGIALVRVADDVFLRCLVRGAQRPLAAGGEPAAAAPAQAGIGDLLDDVLGRHLGQHLAEGGIAVHRDVFLDALGIDHAAVAQHHAVLRFVECGIIKGNVALHRLVGAGVVIHQPLHDAALEQMLVHDLVDVLRLDAAVERAVRMHDDHGAERAQTEAAGLDDLDLVLQPACRDAVGERLLDRFAA